MAEYADLITADPDCETLSTRLLQATPELVFRAWTEADHLKKWWGPSGFTNTFEVFEPVAGGQWKFTMHGPEGGNYENESRYLILDEPYLIVFDHISPPEFRVAVTLERVENNTRLKWKMIFDTKEACDKLKIFVLEKNEENLDRLEAELLIMQNQSK